MISTEVATGAPSTWIETTFGEIAEYVTSGSRDWSKYYSDEGALFIRTQNINTNRLRFDDVARVSLPEKVEGKRTRVYPGDILITITGANVGKVALVEGEIEEAYVSQSVALVRLKDKRIGKFLHYQLITKFKGDKTHLESMAYGLGRPVLNLENIRNVPIRLTSQYQQKRIVEEIEKQFSRLGEAVANLKRVKANLKRYKAAVLKAAVEGRLVETEAERARRESRSYETGEQLLQRILKTRRSQWQGKGKYKEPAAPDTTDLPDLPEGWVWATYAQVGEVTTGFTPPTADAGNFGGDVPFFKPTDLDAGDNVVEAREYLSKKGAEKGRVLPAGSVLVTCIGATIGKTGLARVDCATNQQINAVSPQGSLIAPNFVYSWTVSPLGYKQIVGNASATTLPILNKSKFEALGIPVPPLEEQQRIVAEVDRRLSLLRETEAQVDANLRRAERLRQSILSRAFSGDLLSKDVLRGRVV